MDDLLREEVGRLRAASPHSKSKKMREQPWLNYRFTVADLILRQPDIDKAIAFVAEVLGEDERLVRVWVETAEAEPDPAYRIAPWTTHRDLRKDPRRREIIQAGLKTRDARKKVGKDDIDRPNVKNSTIEELADDIIESMLLPGVEELVKKRKELSAEKRKLTRDAAAAKRAEERERSQQRFKNKQEWQKQTPYRIVSELNTKLVDFEGCLKVITGFMIEYGEAAVPPEYWQEAVDALKRIGDRADDTRRAMTGPVKPHADWVDASGTRPNSRRPRELPSPE